jgi:hypothetical protein
MGLSCCVKVEVFMATFLYYLLQMVILYHSRKVGCKANDEKPVGIFPTRPVKKGKLYSANPLRIA